MIITGKQAYVPVFDSWEVGSSAVADDREAMAEEMRKLSARILELDEKLHELRSAAEDEDFQD